MRSGKTADAAAIYKTLFAESQPRSIRLAALKGMIATQTGPAAIKMILDNLQSPDPTIRSATLAAIGNATKELKNEVAAALPELNTDAQLLLIPALAEQNDVSARPSLLKIIDGGKDAAVRTAGLLALASHGEPADLPMLVKMAASEGSTDAATAKHVLERMSRAGIDEAMIKMVETTSGAQRSAVIVALAGRRVDAATGVLVKMAGGSDADAALAAVKGLSLLGGVAQLRAWPRSWPPATARRCAMRPRARPLRSVRK